MNQPSREQIEARLTALLLGELPAAEAELLRWTIAQDADLQKLHDELQSTIGLVREIVKPAITATTDKNEALKLSDERRKRLLAHFKAPRPKPLFWLKRIQVPSLISVLALLAIVAVLAAMLLPSLAAAKKKSQHPSTLGGTRMQALDKQTQVKELQYSTWSGDNADRSEAVAAAPANAPATVTLAPEPILAPPPVQIVLPSTESSLPATSRTGSLADSGNAGVYSQNAAAYVNEQNSLGVSQPVLLADGNNQSAGVAQPSAAPNAFGRSVGGEGGGGGGGTGLSRLARLEPKNESEKPRVEAPSATATPSYTLGAEGDSGANRSVAESTPAQLGRGFSLLGPVAHGSSKEVLAGGNSAAEPIPSSPAAGYTFNVAPADAAPSEKLPALALNENSADRLSDKKSKVENSDQLLTSGLRDRNDASSAVTPTLDGQDLRGGNQQLIEGRRLYQEQLAQLQELKTIQTKNPEKLRDVLPQVVPDANLNDLLGKRKETQQKMATMTNNYVVSKANIASTAILGGELDRQINDRVVGIMAGLASQVNAKKAALDALTASVEAAKQNDHEEASKNQPYYDQKRNLEQKLKMHEMLYAKLEAEKLDLELPKSSMVQQTDFAEPSPKTTFWQKLTGEYESKARMKVENDATDIVGLSGPPDTTGYNPYFIQTTFEIIQSDAVLGKAVDALKLVDSWSQKNGGEKLTKKEAIGLLKKRLDLQPVKNTKLIEIGATSDNPEEAAKIANAVAKAYADYRVESRMQLTTNGLKTLGEQYAQQEKEIRLAQAEVDRLEKELNPEQADVAIRKPAPNAPVSQPEILTRENAFSTFSLNVSDVSFKLAAASLEKGQMPDAASIRSEEFINAFDYRDPEAAAGQPLTFTSERARYPFAHNRDLLRFSVKTAAAGRSAGRALNLVLLLDNSGSMERADRVQIIREALRVLATQLQPQDTVSVVTFARTARLWADGVAGDKVAETLERVGGITPEGGTNLEEAMRLAYETARRHYLANGMNRVVLLTDGAANLGNVDAAVLKEKVEAQRKQGIALDCFGIGWEGFNDDLLEQLSRNGDGRYAFLNSPEDTSQEFAAKLAGVLQVAASDVKVQVEFNPQRVISYRQIGYAKHQLTKEQFRDNTVDAAEIAAQEAGNALYTIETKADGIGPVATVRVRYKVTGSMDYRERSWDVPYTGSAVSLEQSSAAMRLVATASAFSEWLAASPFAQEVSPDELLKTIRGVPEIYGADERPKKLEWMIRQAKSVAGK